MAWCEAEGVGYSWEWRKTNVWAWMARLSSVLFRSIW